MLPATTQITVNGLVVFSHNLVTRQTFHPLIIHVGVITYYISTIYSKIINTRELTYPRQAEHLNERTYEDCGTKVK
ncbi:hypothetical protein E2C01_037952 [Portunus trituberculatus]|uniref:Uncharacterized protein n=1 Tax=Portunus trituberculatus TaxID=210409 RepID=A0A5B7FAW5_PORTR|nr:hypothetical protein [Portunus trituberculatus]